MSAEQFLAEIEGRGVTVVRAGDKLRYRPAGALTPELLKRLREHKAPILELLGQRDMARHAACEDDESLGHWMKRVRANRRRACATDEPRREPPAEPTAAPGDRPRLSPLAAAMLAYLRENPHDVHEMPGWIGTTCWAFGYHEGRPTPDDSKAAAEELRTGGHLTDVLHPAGASRELHQDPSQVRGMQETDPGARARSAGAGAVQGESEARHPDVALPRTVRARRGGLHHRASGGDVQDHASIRHRRAQLICGASAKLD